MWTDKNQWDVIVVGGGHAGCEAALAAARMGSKTLLLTLNIDKIGWMSCNPAIGGIAKGHLVKEIDALGGQMAKNIDATGIMFRKLNTSKGPAVRSSRAQADMWLYAATMRETIETQPGLSVKQASVQNLMIKGDRIVGVDTNLQVRFLAKAVVITTGTFLRGLMHIGENKIKAGRAGEGASYGLTQDLLEHDFAMGRLKTGTTPRLDGRTIDFSTLEEQQGDPDPQPFSFFGTRIVQPQVSCHITWTNEKTHDIIRENLKRSPMFSGDIEGVGPRYCPSIEDKVHRFADKNRHQIFLEPEGLQTREYYPNGISTSLPIDAQMAMVRAIPGLENVEITRPGYAVEYDFVEPTQLFHSLETKRIANLFLAGQINGTSGYEEAGAQGLVAGINAVRRVQDREPFHLGREEAYIGVLIDDLITHGATEPYRMFTSRAEYRLLLREDNADLRLTPKGRELGLISDERWEYFTNKREDIEALKNELETARINPNAATNKALVDAGTSALRLPASLDELLRRPEVDVPTLRRAIPDLLGSYSAEVEEEVEIEIKYAGYIERQETQVQRFRKLENLTIPKNLKYDKIGGLSNEVIDKLSRIQPSSLGQAQRIEGITPAAIGAMLVYLKKQEIKEAS